ncbi:hypothetical protein BC936DRAFT_137430 [Jimgerdemannia flammicorona]|uniref:Uncharacterized protein n=1 Tax=Jimgerdemannia flammicorona TaxID=994334 RepID=A0A433CXD4_9FUNG|nr:hypothetical protein BC936DRAFT_137430 [Jimgerdemannia flammicorona]
MSLCYLSLSFTLLTKYKRQLGNDLDALWCPREAELARTKLDSAQIDGITKYSSALTDAAVVNLNNVVERHRPSSDKDNPVRKRARTGLAIDDEELREDSDDYQPSAKPLMVNNKGPTSPTRRFSTYLQTTLLPSSPHSTADIPSVDNNEKVQVGFM